jgi:hypothetical protein
MWFPGVLSVMYLEIAFMKFSQTSFDCDILLNVFVDILRITF